MFHTMLFNARERLPAKAWRDASITESGGCNLRRRKDSWRESKAVWIWRVMSARGAETLYLRALFPWRTRHHTYTCVGTVNQREESVRPLSLLIKPNRNRKAESKLHNYTGLRFSLVPARTTFISLSFASLRSSFYSASFFRVFGLFSILRASREGRSRK